jgi:ribosomally synthesized peptide (Cys-rich family)
MKTLLTKNTNVAKKEVKGYICIGNCSGYCTGSCIGYCTGYCKTFATV